MPVRQRYYRRKSFWSKLFTSPTDHGFMDTPFIFYLLGTGFCGFALNGLITGVLDVGRYSENIIHYDDGPGFFMFAAFSMFGLGLFTFYWGWRKWRQHHDK